MNEQERLAHRINRIINAETWLFFLFGWLIFSFLVGLVVATPLCMYVTVPLGVVAGVVAGVWTMWILVRGALR